MIKIRKIFIAAAVIALLALVLLTACDKKGKIDGGDETPEVTERPTEVPMRDLSNDTPMADTVVYANRMANEVQAFNSTPERSRFTAQNSVTKFEFEMEEPDNKGITYFGDYYGDPYFTGSMDTYIIDAEGQEWSDRYSGTDGRQNTYRIGYYYTEVHLMDLKLGLNTGDDMSFSGIKDIFNSKSGWREHMCRVNYVDEGVKITVNDASDPYAVSDLKENRVPKDSVNAIRISVISKINCTANIYYYDSETKGFNSDQRTTISLKGDGAEHTYIAPLDLIKGDLSGIRFDPDGQVGDSFIITGIEAVKIASSVNAKIDRTYHVYSDKLHQSFRIVAVSDLIGAREYGIVWKVEKDIVDALQIRDGSGIHSDLSFDSSSVEYVAFHIIDNGVVGIIIPAEDSGTDKVTVEDKDGYYIVRQFTDAPKDLEANKDHTMGNRLHNDKTSTFDAIDKEADLERHPLTDIQIIDSNARAKFTGYDYIKGCYIVTKNGSDFNGAYQKNNRNKYFTSKVTVSGDASQRNIYMRFAAKSGSLECAALLDENDMLLPVPMEVCKNFSGEYEEPFYDPKDTQYGDSIFPLVVKSGESVTFTEIHLYQNWGIYALKQISSIQFFIGYYHLSTGVTESNCIAPYFVYGKDGWTLPDFRGCSGVMWSGQPQFTSVGINKWLSYMNNEGIKIQSEYTGTDIRSSGQTYADMDYSYISDCGSYKFTLRHVEFPQNDENRTYYTISVEFLKDLTIGNVRDDFNIIFFDSRDSNFTDFMYLSSDGSVVNEKLPTSGSSDNKYELQKGSFYYAIYGPKTTSGADKTGTDVMNYALIMRSSDVTVGGKKWDGTYLVRYSFDGKLDHLALTFNEGKMAFKKGDRMEFNVILLPFGGKTDDVMNHVPVVYEDSVLYPVRLTAVTGSIIEDEYIPKILAENNTAEFILTGSRNLNTVVVYGIDVLKKPKIYKLEGESCVEYDTSVKGYDGYQVSLCEDGTYAYSFVYEIGSPQDEVRFKVEFK